MAQTDYQTILITGAASGIGKCFTEYFLRSHVPMVIAADINHITITSESVLADEVHDHHEPYSSIHNASRLVSRDVDFSDPPSIQAFVEGLEILGISHIDLVIHSAGIRGLVPAIEQEKSNDVAAAETLNTMTPETMLRTYQINALGTFTLLQSLHQHGYLSQSPKASMGGNPLTKVVIMSSRMGSISYNTTGGAYAYRASKAALNAIIKSMSIDVPEVIFTLVHPGRVETRLTKCREEGAIEVEESVQDMLAVMERLTSKDSGRFLDRFGVDIGW